MKKVAIVVRLLEPVGPFPAGTECLDLDADAEPGYATLVPLRDVSLSFFAPKHAFEYE